MARNRCFSRKRTCKPFWPRDLRLVLLCIKLWLVHGGGTIRVSKFIILSSVWASNYQLQRHLNGPKKARNVKPRVQKSMKTSANVFYKESVHIRDVAKKLTRALKIVCYDPRKWPEVDVFRENALVNSKPFWPRDLRLMVLYIKLWWVHVGGTVSVEIHHCVFRLGK
jgi:hypothetical protein